MSVEELRDVRPPVAWPFDLWWLVILLIVLTIAGGIFLYFWLRKHVRKETAGEPAPPPWETARRELDGLEAEFIHRDGEVESFFIRVSSVIRLYLERRFMIRAPEMTTDEFLTDVRDNVSLGPEMKDDLKEFLILCDMVKFARYSCSRQEMISALEIARRIVLRTVPQSIAQDRPEKSGEGI